MLLNNEGGGFAYSSYIIRGEESRSESWAWSMMSSAWFYLYNFTLGGSMTIDFKSGIIYYSADLGEFEPN